MIVHGRRSTIARAIVDSLPLFVPAVPFALVLGLAVIESGMNPLIGWSTSWFIFGGAAQLTLVSLLGSGVAAATLAALVVNARHLMYSAALAPTFQSQPRWFRWIGPYLLIDQVFALTSLKTDDRPALFRTYYIASGMTFWFLWVATTGIGLIVGPVVPADWQLEFAVPILFVGLIVIGIDTYPKGVAAVVGAAMTVLASGLPSRSGLLLGALAGVAAGALVEYRRGE